MSREIVRSCVSGHRAQIGVSGLRGRCAVLGSVPAAAMGGLGVLRDGRAAGVAERDGGGVPDDGDLLAFAFVASVELAGENTEVAALGNRPHGSSDAPCRRVVASTLHGCAGRGAWPVVEAGRRGAGVVDDVLAVIVEDLEGCLVPEDVHGLSGPAGGDVEHAREHFDLPVLFDLQVDLAVAGVQRQWCSALRLRHGVDAVDARSR